jgi:hypothetical protein
MIKWIRLGRAENDHRHWSISPTRYVIRLSVTGGWYTKPMRPRCNIFNDALQQIASQGQSLSV